VGENRGKYKKVIQYEFVGDGGGDFDVPEPPPRSNCCGAFLLCMFLGVMFVVVAALIGWNMGVVSPAMLGVTSATVSPVPPLAVATTTVAVLTMAPPTTTTQTRTVTIQYNCEKDVPEVGDKVQAASDIMFQPAAMVPRGTYGRVVNFDPLAPDHAFSVSFDGFPHLQNASVSVDRISQAVQPGDRVKAAKALGGESGGAPAVPRDTVGTVAKVVPPGDDGWEILYYVTWDGVTGGAGDLALSREKFYKVDPWSPGKSTWCCAQKGVGCAENCATNETWAEEKSEWCCDHHGIGCAAVVPPTSTTVTTQTTTSTTTRALFNCYMQEDWSDEKQEWCCKVEHLGCKPEGGTSL
jgi:hypothetical protein